METKHLKLLWGIALIATVSMPFLLTMPALHERFNFTETGNIGNTIAGLTTPIISLFAVFVVYMTFQEQVKTNKFIANQEISTHILSLEKYDIETLYTKFFDISDRLNTQEIESDVMRTLDEMDYFFKKFSLIKSYLQRNRSTDEFIFANTRLIFNDLFRTYNDDIWKRLHEYVQTNAQGQMEYAGVYRSKLELLIDLMNKLMLYFGYEIESE